MANITIYLKEKLYGQFIGLKYHPRVRVRLAAIKTIEKQIKEEVQQDDRHKTIVQT